MRGFMCQSVEATSACTISDPRSVIVPRRPENALVEKNRLLNSAHQYSQPAEWTHMKQFHPEANHRRSSSVLVPPFKREDERKKDPASSVYCDPVKQLTLGSSTSNKQFQLAEWTRNKQFHPEASHRRSSSVLVPPFKREDERKKDPASSVYCDPVKQLALGSSTSNNVFQVVVMRVSLHCQGCAGKLKKHISKMEGVTSYSIDLETKRVVVMGHVSPDGVLESISKVKRAEFWPN